MIDKINRTTKKPKQDFRWKCASTIDRSKVKTEVAVICDGH